MISPRPTRATAATPGTARTAWAWSAVKGIVEIACSTGLTAVTVGSCAAALGFPASAGVSETVEVVAGGR